MASIQDTLKQINQVCSKKGGKYSQYSCKTVSWDDANRGTVGGNVSCWGSNITDTYLNAKDGRKLFTVRPDNWNEKLGYMSSKDVALVTGNQTSENILKPITLENFLKNSSKFGKYAKLDENLGETLHHENLDKKVSIRFQTTFLPVDKKSKSNLEFCTEAYNYNTRSESDPRNLILLCTTQGLALQQDGSGTQKLFHHSIDQNSGVISRHWLEAEKSSHKVGGSQIESKEEKEDAIKRGKATSSVIGIKAMGTRFNVLMTIQIPLQQTENTYRSMTKSDESMEDFIFYESMPVLQGMTLNSSISSPKMLKSSIPKKMSCYPPGNLPRFRSSPKIGQANAARVSKGSKHDTWPGLTKTNPKRNDNEHITVTCVIYNTISGGVPSENDIMNAIDDMENLYSSCTDSGRLGDSKFNFMKDELTVKNVIDIKSKISEQPVKNPVENFDCFPE